MGESLSGHVRLIRESSKRFSGPIYFDWKITSKSAELHRESEEEMRDDLTVVFWKLPDRTWNDGVAKCCGDFQAT